MSESVLEQSFLKHVMVALGTRSDLRIHRQNVGKVQIIKRGKFAGIFEAGPPNGAADLSGIVGPNGYRIEIELKGQRTEVRPAQDAWMAMIHAFGGIYVRARYDESFDMEHNVSATSRAIDEAIAARRSRPPCR